MLKHKFKIIALLMVIILSVALPVVRATQISTDLVDGASTESSDDEYSIQPISAPLESPIAETPIEPRTSTGTEEHEDNNQEYNALLGTNMVSSDLYLFEDNVTIDYLVDGNAFIIADTVIIDSQIGGDVFVCAKNVIVRESAYIYSGLFALAETVSVAGTVCDLYAAANTIDITGTVYRDARIGGDSFNLSGLIGRDAYLAANKIELSNEETNTMVGGNFNYVSISEVNIPENAVSGTVNFTQKTEKEKDISKPLDYYITSLIKFVCTIAIIWLLALWIKPKTVKEPNDLLLKKFFPILGIGFLTPIVLVVAFVLLLVLGLTSNIAILTMLLFIIACIISHTVFVISANNAVCSKLKVEKTIQSFGLLIVTSAVYWAIINFVPTVGAIFAILGVLLGLGIITYSILPFKSKNNETKVTEIKTEE